MRKLTLKQKNEIVKEWIMRNGAATFDLKNKDIFLHDGGLFYIDTETRLVPDVKFVKVKNGKGLMKGASMMVNLKRKSKVDFHTAILWFNELHETINYLKRMEKMLNSLGYETRIKKQVKRR